MNGSPDVVVQKRMSFLTAAMLGGSAVLITAIVCGTGLAVAGLTVLNHRADEILDLGRSALVSLPQWSESLPPAVSDAFDDARAPEYCDSLKVTPRLIQSVNKPELSHAVLEIENNGDQVVSMLAVHSVLLSARNAPLREFSDYAATPIALPDGWRGPLLPGSKRQLRLGLVDSGDGFTLASEITDLRVWSPDDAPAPSTDAGPKVAKAKAPPARMQ